MIWTKYIALGLASIGFAAAGIFPAIQTFVDPTCIRLPAVYLSIVRPTFSVYTREKSDRFVLSSLDNAQSNIDKLVNDGFFQRGRQVVFIIHGYFGNLACPVWMTDMKNAILMADDSTVITVTWSWGADYAYYGSSATTTQTVSSAVAALAEAISKSSAFSDNANELYLHCIGHSLGAHTCGQAGRIAKSATGAQLFDRVTGLDPAGPGFEICKDNLHIDKDSAKCVDNIHTDGSLAGHYLTAVYYGTLKSWGHVDFYPNGGSDQPSCALTNGGVLGCHHMSAIQYFTLSVHRNGAACVGVGACGNTGDMPKSCSNQTQRMGYYSSCHRGSSQKMEGNFYVDVKSEGSQCKLQSILTYCATLEGMTIF